jgi:hypothetical protein
VDLACVGCHDVQAESTGHHLTSLLLHIANTVLLFLWLRGATGRQGCSAFVALGFGLYPVHVESVAWVAERAKTC